MTALVLTAREEHMLDLLAEGLDIAAIAQRLGYEPGTMRVYMHKLYRKIGVSSRAAAVARHHKQRAAPSPDVVSLCREAIGSIGSFDRALQAHYEARLGALLEQPRT